MLVPDLPRQGEDLSPGTAFAFSTDKSCSWEAGRAQELTDTFPELHNHRRGSQLQTSEHGLDRARFCSRGSWDKWGAWELSTVLQLLSRFPDLAGGTSTRSN